MLAVQIGGGLMILAAVICYFVVNEKPNEPLKDELVEELKIIEERPI
jgi:maltose/moltooligosaccharide transporter